MAKLEVRDLVFSGRHGTTGRERYDAQRFKVDIVIDIDTTRAEQSDSITDTYDYKHAKNIAKEVIEGAHQVLIETLAARIAERVASQSPVQAATVTIQKVDASSNGLPAITIEKKRTPQEQEEHLLDFNLINTLTLLDTQGAVSLPILSEAYRRTLLEEAQTYEYAKQPEFVGPNNVREELSSVTDFPLHSKFWQLKEDFEECIGRKCAQAEVDPFVRVGPSRWPLEFNELSLQHYARGSFGISPHQDFSNRINLIAVFILTGKARFALCDDKAGSNPCYLDTTPGNVILLRAPGFLRSGVRPIHVLRDIEEDRIVFGLRQKGEVDL
jgi:dihydroneopterin aldolase